MLEDSYEDGVSEWNEQMLYSKMYFSVTAQCRDAQASGDVITWYNYLLSKLLMAIPICKKDKREQLTNYRLELDKLYYNTISSVRGEDNKRAIAIYHLRNRLFEVEAIIDTLVNEVMPFLNIGREGDIEQF